MSREGEPRRRKLGRQITAATVVAGALAVGPMAGAASASESHTTDAHRAGVTQLDTTPSFKSQIQFDLPPSVANVAVVEQAAPIVEQPTPAPLTEMYDVDRGDTMNSVADDNLDDALDTDPTAVQTAVNRVVNAAANPQVTDIDRIYDNRTRLNIVNDDVTAEIAQAAAGQGDAPLVAAVAEVINAETFDDKRTEAIDVLQAVGITPVRAEDSTPAQAPDEEAAQIVEAPERAIPEVTITVPDIEAAVTSGVLDDTRTLAERGDNLWDNTETVLEEGTGQDPRNAQINPISRVEQVINTTLTPDINFNRMPVKATYTGLSDTATLVVGTLATVDRDILNVPTISEDVRVGVDAIQSLNEQSRADTGRITSADRAATKLVLSMKPELLTQALRDQIAAIYGEQDETRKNEMFVALLGNPLVVSAVFGEADAILMPADAGAGAPDANPVTPGTVDEPDTDPTTVAPPTTSSVTPAPTTTPPTSSAAPVPPVTTDAPVPTTTEAPTPSATEAAPTEDLEAVAPPTQAPGETVAPAVDDTGFIDDVNEWTDANRDTLGLVAGGTLAAAALGTIGLVALRRRRTIAPILHDEDENEDQEKQIVGRIMSNPMTEEEEDHYLMNPDNSVEGLSNSFTSQSVDEIVSMLSLLKNAGSDINVNAFANNIEDKLTSHPVPLGYRRRYRIANRVINNGPGYAESKIIIVHDDVPRIIQPLE